MSLFEWVFAAEFVVLMVLRFWFARAVRSKPVAARQLGVTERVLLSATFLGMMIIPLIYFFTSWLAFADYRPPAWLGWLGVPLAIGAAPLFWRSHADLGANWSPTLEVREEHRLVSDGVYRRIRHPMYAAIWLWVVSQALLLPNWVAGLAGIVSFAPLYFLRVPREERMMMDTFGDDYLNYMQRTGRLVPVASLRQ